MNIKKSLILIIISTLFVLSWQSQAADVQKQLSIAQWNQDVEKLFSKIRILHPNPWRTVSEKKFRQHLKNIANMSILEARQQTISKLIAAVAMITKAGRDGHTRILPWQSAADFHLLPLGLYWFSDGIYIVATDDANKALLGRRVTAISGKPIELLLGKISAYVSNENASWLKNWSPLYALTPELLASLKLSRGLSVSITTENSDGTLSTKKLQAISANTYANTFPQAFITSVLPVSSTAPMYLQKLSGKIFWYKRLDESTLYIQYNQAQNENNDEQSFSDFIDLTEIEIKKHQLTNLIVDLRNSAGDNADYSAFLDMLNNFKAKKRALDLYVLTGRATFSAAINFTTDLANKSNAIFVGESTGGSPNHYGDPVAITLPNSKLSVRIATKFSNKAATDDKRLTHKPDYLVQLTAGRYFSKRDPALDKILELIEIKSFE